MKKSVLSLIIILMIMLNLCCSIPAMAMDAPAEVAEDFVAGEITGNLITKYPTDVAPTIYDGKVGAGLSGTSATLKANNDLTNDSSWGLVGFKIDTKFMDVNPTFDEGDKLLLSFKVKNDATTSSSKINNVFTRTKSTYIWSEQYPTSSDGLNITGDGWTVYNSRTTVDKTYDESRSAIVGFSKGTTAGTKILIDMPSMYFGKEYAHDIKMTVTGSTDIEAGEDENISADVDILNQLGAKHSTQGTFNWYALDKTRTQIVPGITITPGEDGTASINVGASVPADNYVIAAQSAENPTMVKSFSINVGLKNWDEHEAVLIDNWLSSAEFLNNWSGHVNSVPAFNIGNGAVGKTITSTDIILAPGGGANNRIMGVYAKLDGAAGTGTYPAGTKFIISFKVRNLTTEKTAKINATLYNAGMLKSYASKEYPSISYDDCFEILGEDWNTYKAIFVLPESVSFAYTYLDIGFPKGTTNGVAIEFDDSSFYFAPYKASDVKIIANTGVTAIDPGVVNSFTADIVDYAGNAMDGEENFAWALLNVEKTVRVQGVTFTPDATDSSTVNVVADKTVVPGNYYLAAESISGETAGWIKSIPVTVLKPTIHDYVAGTIPGEIDDIIITRTDSGSETMGLTDTAEFSASVVDTSDAPVAGEQKFVWSVMDETRKEDVTSEFAVVPSSDTTTAAVTPKLTTANGTYYVMAQYADNEEIVKAIKIVIDKAQSVENGANLINNGSASDIGAQLSDVAVIVGVSDELKTALSEASGVVKAETAEILAASFGDENLLATDNADEVTEAIEMAVVIALYNENPETISLYDAEGKFVFEEELGLADIDADGVTLYNVFNTILSDEGRNAMQETLSEGGHTTIDGFYKTLKENIVLYGVKYPDEIGVSYLERVLTEKNLEAAGIDAPKYLARGDKSETHKNIARNLYTVDTLKAALEAEPENGQGGTTGGLTGGTTGGGGGGGGYSAPIETSPSDTDLEETTNNNYPKFSDVPEEHWAYTDIYYLRERNIISGLDKDHFNPNGNITREQFAKILCAALEIETTAATTNFADVDSNAWYAPYISAILEKGIVTGVNNESFGVGANITRQDLCTMIYRAIDNEKFAYTALGFTDDESISDYARDAVATLKGLEIVNGYEDGTFNPKGLCTRAEAAKIICKLLATQEVLR